jgi:hypothetical protein
LLQGEGPLVRFNVYLDGFHFANGSLADQMEAHHFCQVVNKDFRQCVLFDGDGTDARLVGIEYVVSRRVAVRRADAADVAGGRRQQPCAARTRNGR